MSSERYAISGSHGFLGEYLMARIPEAKRMGRGGFVPVNTDVIFNLAAYGNLTGQEDIKSIYQANLIAVINAVESLGANQKFVFVSTSSVNLPVQTYYSASKKAAEEALKISGANIAIVRPASVTGKGEQSIHLIPRLIDSCLNGTFVPFVPGPTH